MTYQQVLDTMSRKERFAILKCLGGMKVDKAGNISACSVRNLILYRIAKMILRRNPWDRAEFYFTMINDPNLDQDELKADLTRLRIAYH